MKLNTTTDKNEEVLNTALEEGRKCLANLRDSIQRARDRGGDDTTMIAISLLVLGSQTKEDLKTIVLAAMMEEPK